MKYLILPMQPTPNGRLHIGHGGGTYLRADVLARSLRAEGHQVRLACGTDAYENWVLAAAITEDRPPEEVCATYHAGIRADLDALGVHVDTWIDPLAPAHRQPYLDLHTELFDMVKRSGAAALRTERVPFAVTDGTPLLGTFVAGHCPHCLAPAGGSSCTACGQHFQPDQLVRPRARLSHTALDWREQQNWFLAPGSPAQLLDALNAGDLHPRHVQTARQFLERGDGTVRLSGPGRWGVSSPALPADRILSNSYYAYCVYLSRLMAWPEDPEPFATTSSTTTIGVFGTDNSVPGLVVPGLYAQATGRLKPFDHVLVHGMLDLDGQKCSTSNRHGIWLTEAVTDQTVSGEELRYALAGVDLDSGRANLDLADLVHSITELRRVIRERVIPAARQQAAGTPDPALLAAQRDHLQPGTLHLPAAQTMLGDYLRAPHTDAAAWIATVAALAAPLMPRLSDALRAEYRQPGRVARVVGEGELTARQIDALVHRAGETIRAPQSTP